MSSRAGAIASSGPKLACFRFLVAALVLAISSLCFGQTADPKELEADPRREEAKGRFEHGLELARAGAWEAALVEFQASREIFATRSATRNAAIALQRLNRPVEAIQMYQALLTEFGPSIPPDQLASIRNELNELSSRVGEVQVAVSERDVVVVVDGVQVGETPLTSVIQLNPGMHTVRLSKEGFESVELQVTVAPGKRTPVQASLKRLTSVGVLAIQEAGGANLDVVVDSVVVGKSPWRGNVAPGLHRVHLRGEHNLGTPPSSADVVVGRTTTLTLRAVTLDSRLRIEPVPSNAAVFVDGVSVGNGIWEGYLPSGSHRVELTASGHFPFRRQLRLLPKGREVIRAELERDMSSPLWSGGFRPHPFAEIAFGPLWSPAFNGADSSCSCSDRSRPLGVLGSLRVGYAPLSRLGLELSVGYLTISEQLTRRVEAKGESNSPRFDSTNYEDSTRLSGPLAMLSASYRVLERTPLTARVGVGFAVLSSMTSNEGTFRGDLARDPVMPGEPVEIIPITSRVDVPEIEQRLLTPFGSLELRAGYRFSKRFSADLGIAALLMLAPSAPRAGATTFSGERDRVGSLPESEWADGSTARPGTITLPIEEVADTFVALSPSIAVRLEF